MHAFQPQHPDYPLNTILRRHFARDHEDYRVIGRCRVGMFDGLRVVSLSLAPHGHGAAFAITITEAHQMVAVGLWEPGMTDCPP